MAKYDAMRAEIEKLRKQQAAAMKALGIVTREMRTHDVPAKHHTKGKKASRDWTQRTLQGVPGGRGPVGFARMCDSERTGTKVASEEQEKRLGLIRSAQNSNTTSTQHDAKVRGLIR